MYLGVSTLNIDAKGRLAIPAKYRDALAEACGSRLAVTINPSKTNRCLWLYPEDEWLNVARKLTALPAADRKAQAYRRLILGHASEQELDAQGRIRISPELREFAGLEKRVMLLGQGNKFEIWDIDSMQGSRERWIDDVESAELEGSDQFNELSL